MSVFFGGSWGMNRSAGQTNRVNREAVLVWFVCSALRFIPHEPRKKKHSFLIFTMFPTRTLSKILREKLFIQNSHSNGHFTSFDVLITAHVIRPNRRTFCWLCSSGIGLNNFSRVQRRKYDTIVNRGKETVPFAAVCYGVYCFHSKTTLIMWLALQLQHTKINHWKSIVPLVLICYWYIAFKVTLLYPLDLHY